MLYQQQGVHGRQPNCFWGVVRGLGCWGHCPSFWQAWGTLAPGYPYLKGGLLLVLGTIELHKHENGMFCGLCTNFVIRSRQMEYRRGWNIGFKGCLNSNYDAAAGTEYN